MTSRLKRKPHEPKKIEKIEACKLVAGTWADASDGDEGAGDAAEVVRWWEARRK